MERTKTSTDSFGTFLERLHDAVDKPGDPGLRLLTVLEQSGPATRASLFARSDLDLVSFAAGFDAVRSSGFIASHGKPGDEILELTPSGREVVLASH